MGLDRYYSVPALVSENRVVQGLSDVSDSPQKYGKTMCPAKKGVDASYELTPLVCENAAAIGKVAFQKAAFLSDCHDSARFSRFIVWAEEQVEVSVNKSAVCRGFVSSLSFCFAVTRRGVAV